jgi:hypothetical protein
MNSRLNFNLLVSFLGFTVLVDVIGGIVLTYADKSIPDALIALGSAALGALGTAFINPPNGDSPLPVSVENEPVRVTTGYVPEEGSGDDLDDV